MDKLIQALIDLIPFNNLLQKYLSLSETVSTALATILNILLMLFVGWLVKTLYQRHQESKAAKELLQFDKKEIRERTQYYVETQSQNFSPSNFPEPRDSNKRTIKRPLIPFFLETAFKEEGDDHCFYVILADSGMGKTTFLVNLYMRYMSFGYWKRPKGVKMKLFRLGFKDTLEIVKKISKEEAMKTILLLDALDEDPYILQKAGERTSDEAFDRRVNEIVEATQYFKEVVLACRTQYFPTQEDDPRIIKVPKLHLRSGYVSKVKQRNERGFHVLNKLYISPFDNADVKNYLAKKYPFWQREKKKQANQIVLNTPNLIVRPMLLNYIDFLLEDKVIQKAGEKLNNYTIYERLIEAWLYREAEKWKGETEWEVFTNNLRNLSQQIAIDLYRRFKKQEGNNAFLLTKEEAIATAQKYNIQLKPNEVIGQSLLTCDAAGNWKFAHKSILEFFIAKGMFKNGFFAREVIEYGFSGMDMILKFYVEKRKEQISKTFIDDLMVYVEGGNFKRGNQEVYLFPFWIGKTQVTQKEWKTIMGNNPSHFKRANKPVEQVNWYDVIEFCNILSDQYGLNPYYNINKNQRDPNNLNDGDNIKWLVTINDEANGFRLPTEAEWEFAARGGIKSEGYTYAGSNNVDKVAWYSKNTEGETYNVKELDPNELGLYDMSGNVWEWCYDWYGEYNEGEVANPIGANRGNGRVLRGGSWVSSAGGCQISSRNRSDANFRYDYFGFRLAYSL